METFTAVSGTVEASRNFYPNIWGEHGVRGYLVVK